MYNVNLCYPYRNEHVWLWVSGDTLGEPQINQECSCGGFLWQGRGLTPRAADGFDRALEEAQLSIILRLKVASSHAAANANR